jgi:hypothetical protein
MRPDPPSALLNDFSKHSRRDQNALIELSQNGQTLSHGQRN